MFSPKFELGTYSWPSAEETRKNTKGIRRLARMPFAISIPGAG